MKAHEWSTLMWRIRYVVQTILYRWLSTPHSVECECIYPNSIQCRARETTIHSTIGKIYVSTVCVCVCRMNVYTTIKCRCGGATYILPMPDHYLLIHIYTIRRCAVCFSYFRVVVGVVFVVVFVPRPFRLLSCFLHICVSLLILNVCLEQQAIRLLVIRIVFIYFVILFIHLPSILFSFSFLFFFSRSILILY